MPAMPPRMARVGAVVALVCLAAGVPRTRAAWESSDGGVLMPGRDMQAVIQQALRRLQDERQAVDAEYSLAQRQCGAQRARASALLALVQDHEATVEDTDRELSELQLRALSVHRARSAAQLRQLSQELRLAREALGLGVGEAQGRPLDEDAAQELQVARGLIDGVPGGMTGGAESPAAAAFLEVAQPPDLAQLREQREAVRQMLRDVDGLVQHHDHSTSTENAFMRGAARLDLALLHDRVAVLERSVQLARDELAHVQHAIDREHAEMQHRAELAGSHRRLLQNVRLQQRLVEQLCALERETFVKQSTRRTEIISTLGAAADAITADDWSVQHIVEDAARHARELQEQRGVAQAKAQKLMEEIMELEAEVAALRGRGALDLDVPQLADSRSATGSAAQLRAEMRAEIRALEAKLPFPGEPAAAAEARGPGAGPRDGAGASAASAADSTAGAATAAEGQADPAIERLEAAMAASDAEAAPQLAAASGGASAAIAELIPAAQEAGQQVTLALERVNAAEGEVRAAQEALAEAAGRRAQLQKDALREAQRLQELKQSLQLADANIERAKAVRDEAAAAEQAHRGQALALDEKARALTRLLEDVRSRSIAFATGVASAEPAAEPTAAVLLELREPQAPAADPRLAVVVQQARGLGVELSETADASASGDQLQAALFVTEQAAAKERQEARFSAERVATATSALQQATAAREAIARDIAVVEGALRELTAQIEAANAEVDGLAQRLREAQTKVRELAAEASEAGEHATELSNQLTAAMAGTVPAQQQEEEGAATGSAGDDAQATPTGAFGDDVQAEDGVTGGDAPEAAGEGEARKPAAAEAPATGGHDAHAPTAAALATGATGSSGEHDSIMPAPAATAATGAGATGTADDGNAERALQRRLRRERRREEREEEEVEKREAQAAREEAEKESKRREAQAQEEAEKRNERERQEEDERRAERERAQRRAQEEAEKLEAELRSMTPEQAQAIVDHVNAVMNALDASPSSSAAVKLSTSYSKVHYERALEILLHEATGDVLDAPTGAAPAQSRTHGEGRASHEDTGAATASTGPMLQVDDSDDDDRKNEREPEHRHEGARESPPESHPEAEPEPAAEDEQPAAEVGGATSGFGEAAMSTGIFQDEWERLHAAMERLHVARKVTRERMGTLRSFSGQANERTVLGQGEEAADVWAPDETVEEGDADAQSDEATEEEGAAAAQPEAGHAAEGDHASAQPDEATSEAAAEQNAATAVAENAIDVTANGESASSTGALAEETHADPEPSHLDTPASATGSAGFAEVPEASTPEAAAVEEIHDYLLDHDIPVPKSLFRLSKPATGGQGTVHFADVFTTPAPEKDVGVDYAEGDDEHAPGAEEFLASPTGGSTQADGAAATGAQADAGATGHASHAEAVDAEPSADTEPASEADAAADAESAVSTNTEAADTDSIDDGAADTHGPAEEEHVPAEATVAPAAEPASPFAQDHSIYPRPVEVNYEMFDQLTHDSKAEGAVPTKAAEALAHGTKVTGVLRWAGATHGKSFVAMLSGSDNQETDPTSGHLVVRSIPDVQGHAAAVQWIYDTDHSLCLASHPTYCLAEPTPERNYLVVVPRDNTRGLRGAGPALPAVAKWVFVMDGRLALERDSRLSMTVQPGHVAIAPAADTEPAFSGQQWLFDVVHGTKA